MRALLLVLAGCAAHPPASAPIEVLVPHSSPVTVPEIRVAIDHERIRFGKLEPDDLENIVVKAIESTPIRLGDIAEIRRPPRRTERVVVRYSD